MMPMVYRANQGRRQIPARREPCGFTLIELLVVIAVIAIVAGLLLPALQTARTKAGGVQCLSRNRQLVMGWLMYAADHEERLVYNLGFDRSRKFVINNWDENWVNNVMSWELEPANTNVSFVAKAKLTPYCGTSLDLYRCPSDRVLSAVQRESGWSGRVRSLSMNAMVGDAGPAMEGGVNVNNPEYKQFLKLTEVPRPVGIFVFLDEHPDSINDGYFLNRGYELEWIDLPASYHGGAAGISFADGHAEMHKWLEVTTRQPNRPDAAALPFEIPAGQGRDYYWLMRRTSINQ